MKGNLDMYSSEKQREYNLQYRQAHKEELLQKQRASYAAHKDEINARRRQDKAKEKNRERMRQYRQTSKNKAYAKDQKAQYYQSHRIEALEKRRQYYEANKEEINADRRQYRKEHPEELSGIDRAHKHKRKAQKKAVGGSYTPQQIQEQLKRQKARCHYCKVKLEKYHVDHVIPLARGGSNDIHNIVLACPTCNMHKHDKLLHEWLEGGRLL